MTSAAEQLTTNTPGRMESHRVARRFAHPRCTLQELDPEDLDQTMCDAISEDDRRRRVVRTDEATFALHQQFLRAHGVPKGEYTTFTYTAAIRGTAYAERTGPKR